MRTVNPKILLLHVSMASLGFCYSFGIFFTARFPSAVRSAGIGVPRDRRRSFLAVALFAEAFSPLLCSPPPKLSPRDRRPPSSPSPLC
jgi:hypothetical protein